jgi:hypothetical protein
MMKNERVWNCQNVNYNRIFCRKTDLIVQVVKIWKNCRIWLRFAEKNVYNKFMKAINAVPEDDEHVTVKAKTEL